MTDDFQEIDGVGPSLEETFKDDGYETYEDLAEADYEYLPTISNYLTEDTALDIVVQAQNLADLEEADVTQSAEGEEPEVEESGESDDEESEAEADESESEPDESEESDDEESEDVYDVTISFDGQTEYETFYHTLLDERCQRVRTNRGNIEFYEELAATVAESSPHGSITVSLDRDMLNSLHNAVLEQRMDYQGDNLTEYMEALRRVEEKVNERREEFLF